MEVAALFVRKNSYYKSIPRVDAFDRDRDALTWLGGCPGVFHPPCRGWGKLRHFSKHPAAELDLARWSIQMVRKYGGVVEHPSSSRLWLDSGCLGFGIRDEFGGVLVPVLQCWWGHRAPKATSLYIVGCDLRNLCFPDGADCSATVLVEDMGAAERERTPLSFARWLVDLAASCKVVV